MKSFKAPWGRTLVVVSVLATALCLALPEVVERLSHGEPAWFIRGRRTFVTFADAGADGAMTLCADASSIDLFTQVQGTPDPGGSWIGWKLS